MKESYYSAIVDQLKQRSVEATISVLGLESKALRDYLRSQLTNDPADSSTILSDPVFESVFPWTSAEISLEDLSGNLLEPKLVEAMDDPTHFKQQAFPKKTKPYTHQLRAWRHLSEEKAKSLIVTSGTGSGKTECFMVPILNGLVKEYNKGKTELEGVEALFIYPLNALINSQRERLSAWTSRFNGNIRFCLYKGDTPEKVPASEQNKNLSEVMSRDLLRTSPPPILITNSTMLEYMLIRNVDKPILDKSQGKLKWIVLDEAHSYIGSQAAELSLLLRRTLHAFGIENPNQVRFIATSATIGTDEKSKDRLRKYLADLAGINESNIEIVEGNRIVPSLPEIDDDQNLTLKDILSTKSSNDHFSALVKSPVAKALRNELLVKPKSLTQLTGKLFGEHKSKDAVSIAQTLQWLDICSNPDKPDGAESFLPLRGHIYHRVINGLWACFNPDCTEKQNTPLADSKWRFGKIYTYQRLKCDCGCPIYEIVICNECNTVHLSAFKDGDRLVQSAKESVDEFSLENENSDDDDDILSAYESRREVLLSPKEGHDTLIMSLQNDGTIDGVNGSGARIYYSDNELTCCECNFGGFGKKPPFRHAYLGTPFYVSNIVPTLLEHCPNGKVESSSRPMHGRSLITFTDSRQGTARISAKMQQDSERNRTRGLVFNIVNSKDNSEEISQIEKEIEELSTIPNKPSVITSLISQKKSHLNLLQNASTSWDELNSEMQNHDDVKVHMLDYYKGVNPEIFESPSILAQILLIREFSRRPKRANSLETLGLVSVSYSGLDKVTIAPNEWIQKGLTLTDWLDFLKICLDFYVRDGVFINIPSRWLSWLGGRYTPKYLLAPNTPINLTDPRHRIWPSYDRKRGNRQQRLIRIIAHALNLDLTIITVQEIDILNSIMNSAWTALTSQSKIIEPEAGTVNFRLKMDKLLFRSISKGWICPITLRILDTTLRGYTPYLPIGAAPGSHNCREVTFPSYLKPTAQTSPERLTEIRNWVAENGLIKSLRVNGLWSEQSDRIIEGGSFFRTAEHSAQQPPERLKLYEKNFKEGRLNVLSCSTTMEMGVDIGGLSMVANNNVPPHPANYLQRAGRAGRRKESRSLVLTICKDNPHDQAVFRNPLWPFTTQLKNPTITLSSVRIVQRHVNALVFTYLLNDKLKQTGIERIKLRCGWFFNNDSDSPSVCDRMLSWIDQMIEGEIDKHLQKGVKSIIAFSILEDHSINQIFTRCKQSLVEISNAWLEEFNKLTSELRTIPEGNEKDPYTKRIERDIDRLVDEHLLSELVARGFLPSYGFPTGIAQFDPYTVEDFKRNRNKSESREDNSQRFRAKPSRNLSMAIREYAPGSDIVLDGLVYKSEGLSLNWHIPQGETDIVENQKIRSAWRCHRCGSSGTAASNFNNKCDECGESIFPENKLRFIQPSGFATGFYSLPTNDVSNQHFIPFQDPWVDAAGDLRPLPNSSTGFFKSSTDGHIFYYSSGEHNNGYALCLRCGRAESMLPDDIDPPMVTSHEKLRGKINGEQNRTCDTDGSDFLIQRGIHLGYEDRTDVFEIYLKNPSTNDFLYAEGQSKEYNLTLSMTLAVAFRQSLASCLGINSEELGFAVKQTRIDKSQHNVYAICLYDNCGGGGGFSSAAPQYLYQIFEKAKEYLECKSNCEGACEHCLLQHDTRKVVNYLNRNIGLAFLNPQFLLSIRLPQEEMLLGETTTYCSESFLTEIDSLGRKERGEISFFIDGNPDDWNIGASSLRKRLPAYSEGFKVVNIVINETSFSELDSDQKEDLYSLISFSDSIRLSTMENSLSPLDHTVLAQFSTDNTTWTFATRAKSASRLSDKWGFTGEELVVKSKGFPKILPKKNVDRNDLIKQKNNQFELVVSSELNGKAFDFGDTFWKVIEGASPEITNLLSSSPKLKHIVYSDRYLYTPLSVLLISKIVNSLSVKCPQSTPFKFDINSMASIESRIYRRRYVSNNWMPDEEHLRRETIENLNTDSSIACKLNITSDRKSISHARTLEISFENGSSIVVRFDQGMGFWETVSYNEFPFHKSSSDQIDWLNKVGMPLLIKNSQVLPTHLFVSIKRKP